MARAPVTACCYCARSIAAAWRVINANLRCIHRSEHFEVCQPSTSLPLSPLSLSLSLAATALSQTSHTRTALAATTTFALPFILGVGERAKQIGGASFHLCSLYWAAGLPVRRSAGRTVPLVSARSGPGTVRSDAKAAAFELCRHGSRKFHQLLRKFSFFFFAFHSRVFCFIDQRRSHLPTRCAFGAQRWRAPCTLCLCLAGAWAPSRSLSADSAALHAKS